MMSHSLAFQMFLEQQRHHIFNKKNSDISSIANKALSRASESNFDKNRSVHTKVLRPRTFDPQSMKSTRRRLAHISKNQSQERHF